MSEAEVSGSGVSTHLHKKQRPNLWILKNSADVFLFLSNGKSQQVADGRVLTFLK